MHIAANCVALGILYEFQNRSGSGKMVGPVEEVGAGVEARVRTPPAIARMVYM